MRHRVSLPWTAYAVAIAPDARRAVVNGGRRIAVVDLGSGEVVGAPLSTAGFDGAEGLPTVAVSPDGDHAMVGRDNLLLEVDPGTGVETRRFRLGNRDLVSSLVWSADGKTLVVGEGTGFIRFLDADFAPVTRRA